MSQDKNVDRCQACGEWIYLDQMLTLKKLLGESLLCSFCAGGRKIKHAS